MIEKINLPAIRRIDPILNQRFRLVANKLNEIIDAIESGAQVGETTSETIAEITETVIEMESKEADYWSMEDKDDLETYARAIGFEIDKRKSLANIKIEISEFVEAQKEAE